MHFRVGIILHLRSPAPQGFFCISLAAPYDRKPPKALPLQVLRGILYSVKSRIARMSVPVSCSAIKAELATSVALTGKKLGGKP